MDGLLYGNVVLLDYQYKMIKEAAKFLEIKNYEQYLEKKN
jgi:hypothetical protein